MSVEKKNVLTRSEQQREQLRQLLLKKIKQPARIAASAAQRRLWLVNQLEQPNDSYNILCHITLRGSLDVSLLEQSFNLLVDRHKVLRTSFLNIDSEIFQVITPELKLSLPVVDLTSLEEADRSHRIADIISQESGHIFDLSSAPLLRLRLLHVSRTDNTATDEYVLVILLHHIISDGWSMGVLSQDLFALYNDLKNNIQTLPALTYQYSDYSKRQENMLLSEEYRVQKNYWERHLEDLTLLELPADFQRPLEKGFNGAIVLSRINAGLVKKLNTLCEQQSVTINMLLSTAFSLLLYRYTNQADIVFGSPVANRNDPDTEKLIGFFVNMLIIRNQIDDSDSFSGLLRKSRENLLSAYSNQDVPFENLVDLLQPERDASRNPIFQVVFAMQNEVLPAIELDGLSISRPVTPGYDESEYGVNTVATRFDLELHCWDTEDDIRCSWIYDVAIFSQSRIEAISRHFVQLLEAIAGQPDKTITSLSILGKQERQTLLEHWNQTQTDYPRNQTVHCLFEQQAASQPDAIALVFEDRTLRYRELNEQANRLAHYLIATGVKPDDAIMVLMERTPNLVIAQLAILKAGAAYVAIDPGYPSQRLSFIIEDTQSPILLTQSSLKDRVGDYQGYTVCLDSENEAISVQSSQNPVIAVSAENLSYVIYTSGSTGMPKGVEVQHGGLMNLVSWHQQAYEVNSTDRATHLAGLGFDASVWELWPYLTSGASLYLVNDERRLSPAGLWSWMAAQGITLSFLPTPLAEAVLCEPVPDDLKLRVLLTGGDRLHAGAVKRSLPFRVVNHYGPTENSVVTTCAEVEGGSTEDPPIGRPIDNVQTYILDKALQPVPVGVWGELYIAGASLARGYLNQPGLTQEKFVANPYSEEPGARMYRSGDLVRYREDGQIEFFGRVDQQVKIRGFRIELGEIESVLCNQHGVQAAVVLMREDEQEIKRLIAYVVPTREWLEQHPRDENVSLADPETWDSSHHELISSLRRHTPEHLPAYMLPSYFVVLDEFPINANGKLDREALPNPGDISTCLEGEYTAPRNEIEQRLAQIWAEVLKLEKVGVHANFFDLGGHSLKMTQVVSRIRERLNIEILLSEMLSHPTVAKLASVVASKTDTDHGDGENPIVAADRTRDLPLSFAQRRLWLLDRLQPGNLAYIIPLALRLNGELNIEVLLASLNTIVNRHEALRTRFAVGNSGPVQIIDDKVRFELIQTDLSALAAENLEQEVLLCLRAEKERPFDLANDRLIRGSLLRLSDDAHVLSLTMHHIVSDGWSLGVLLAELGACYTAFSQGRRPELAELPVQYADFSAWQRQWLSGERLDRQLDYWSNHLADLQVLELPTDRTRPAIQTYDGARQIVSIDKQLSDRLERLSKDAGVTLFMTMLTVYMVMLHRYSGQDDIVIGSPIANRIRTQLEGLMGFFVNMLVMRADCSGNPDFNELIQRVSDMALGAYEHQDIPFEQLVDVLQVERDPSRNPLFQVHFALQSALLDMDTLQLQGLTLAPVIDETLVTRFDLECYVWTKEEGLQVDFIYNTNLFDAATIKQMMQHYVNLLAAVVAEPDTPIDLLPMLSEDEKYLLLQQWNDTDQDYPRDVTLVQLFEAQVARTPDAVAVEFAEQALSYRELDERANTLAHELQAKGVGPGQLVGVHMRRSLEMVISLYGILKAGGAYVPLDPDYPLDRIAYMVAETQLAVLLTQQELQAELADLETVILCVDNRHLEANSNPNRLTSTGATADDLAYVIYTSGSTGKPKGVMNCHKGIVNRLLWMQQAYALQEDDRVLQKTPFSFDVSVWEFFWPLMTGARLVVAKPEGHKDPKYLSRLIRDERISTLHFVPSMLKIFLDNTDAADFSQVKRVFCSGEALPYELQQQFFKAHKEAELHNLYGPTEAAVDVSYWACRRDDSRPLVPIGRPVANTQLYILDHQMQPAPIGVSGELYIGGVQLARGYLGQPELTKEKFVPDPFSNQPEARLYRTGDVAHFLVDGSIEYVGRIDNQIKLRGFRIELGEVETFLVRHEMVKDAVVVVREDKTGEKRLVAYLVIAESDEEVISYVRDYLKTRLPEYMVPSVFMLVEKIELSPNGKVDYKNLPEPESIRHMLKSMVAPKGQLEKDIAEVWKQVLGLEETGVEDNFFDLGGDSFLLIQLHAALEETLEQEIPITDLFRFTTIHSFVQHYKNSQSNVGGKQERLQARASKQRAAMRKNRKVSAQFR